MLHVGVGFDTAIAELRNSFTATNCFAQRAKLFFRSAKDVAIAIAVALLFLPGTLSLAGDLTVPAPQARMPSEIPFHLRQGYLIMVEGRLGNLEHQKLLIDTGTSPSIVDKNVAAKLSLQGTPRSLALFNKVLSAETGILPEVELGPLRRSNIPVMVEDFSKIQSDVGAHVDAVIGLDVLGATSFTIDYQKNQILFHASPQRHSASFRAGPQFITLSLKTGGKELHLLLDTGTPRLVLFRDALRNLDYDWSDRTGTGDNMSGTVSFRTVILQDAHLGREDMGPQAAAVVASQTNVRSNYDGLIGVRLLHPKRLSFDFDRQILGWSN